MTIKLFDNQLFAELDEKAASSPRKRSNCNIHHGPDAAVQRLFITLYPDSYVRPHRHLELNKWEFFLMVSGEVAFLIFDEQVVCQERYHLSANGDIKGLEIPPGVWHTVVPLQQPATFFEVKQGPYTQTTSRYCFRAITALSVQGACEKECRLPFKHMQHSNGSAV